MCRIVCVASGGIYVLREGHHGRTGLALLVDGII